MNLDRAFSSGNLFADSVRHVINGHVAADRYYQISTQRAAVRLSESTLEQRMRELFALDLNPLICMTRQLGCELALFNAWNTYQKHVSLAVRTTIHENANASLRMDRQQISYAIDPPAARNAELCAIDILTGAARSHRQNGAVIDRHTQWRLSEIARELGMQHTLIFEVALCLEENPGLNIAGLCRMMGCNRRTLERHIRNFGVTALDMSRACALSGATGNL